MLPPDPGQVLRQSWTGADIVLSVLIAWWGLYVGLASSSAKIVVQVESRIGQATLVALSGLCSGVCGLWCMQLVSIDALLLHPTVDAAAASTHQADLAVGVGVEVGRALASAALGWLGSALGTHLLMCGRRADSSERESKRQAAKRVATASVAAWAGACGMHYVAMDSIRGTADAVVRSDAFPATVFVLAVAASSHMALLAFLPESSVVRCAAALFISLLYNAGHYCGMSLLTFSVAATPSPRWRPFPQDVAITALVADLLLLGLANLYADRVRQYVSGKAEELEKMLRHRSFVAGSERLIRRAKTMRFPMCLVPHDTFVRCGKLTVHEHLRDRGKLVFVDTLRRARRMRKSGLIIFFSHQWLSDAHPDPTNCQFADMLLATNHLIKMARVKPENVYIWVDYSSVPQEGADQQQLAIESLPTYVSSCSAFVIIAPQVMHYNSKTPCNFSTYSRRLWCRLEVFCMILATLHVWRLKDPMSVDREESGGSSDGDMMSSVLSGGRSRTFKDSSLLAAELNSANRQVFLVLQDTLQPLSFWNEKGQLQPEYANLLYLYEGDLSCCSSGHPMRDGEQMVCDKVRLVEILTGLYGMMLAALQQAEASRNSISNEDAASKALAEEIKKQKNRIFPKQYFETRIDAMDEHANKRCLAQVIEAEEEGEMLRSPPLLREHHHREHDRAEDREERALGPLPSFVGARTSVKVNVDWSPVEGDDSSEEGAEDEKDPLSSLRR